MTSTTSTAAPVKKKHPGGRKKGATSLTVSQKAEAATLWRMGEATLEELSKKFGKRPETFGRLFKRMGIEKGSALKEATEKAKVAATAKVVNDAEVIGARIAAFKEQHIKMSDGLAKVAWSEIVRARQAGLDIAKLKDLMITLKAAGDVIGRSREEMWALLGVEEFDKQKDPDDLPDLTVREMTQGEIHQVRNAGDDDLDEMESADIGADMMPSDEGLPE